MTTDQNQGSVSKKDSNKSSKSTANKIFWNVLVVLGIGVSSMISTQAAKSIYSDKFQATYFVAYTTTIFNVIMFPIYFIVHAAFDSRYEGITKLLNHCVEPYRKENERKRSTYFRAWWILFVFTALWISSIYTYIKSLRYLNPTDVSTLFSTSNVFVFILSIVVLKESFYITKMVSVLIAVTGVVVFCYSENFKFDKVVGILIAVATSLLSATYKVVYKVIIKNGTAAQVCFTLSVIGINTALYYWPFILILHYTNYERVPSVEYIPWKELSIRGSCSVLMNFFITFGIAFINSLVASVGGILAIPLNAIVDTIFKRKPASPLKALGSILIVGSFSLLLIPDYYLDKMESFWKKRRTVPANSKDLQIQTEPSPPRCNTIQEI